MFRSTLANGSKWTGSMYYMYLVARHSGNDEFNAAYAQEDGGSFTSEAFHLGRRKDSGLGKEGLLQRRLQLPCYRQR